MIIRCDDPPANQEANVRRQLRTGASRNEEPVSSTVEVVCEGGNGCTFGAESLQQLYAAGYEGNQTAAGVVYPCISITEIHSLGTL